MKKLFFLLLISSFCIQLYAQNTKGGISTETLKEIQKSYKNNQNDKAIGNAISGNEIKKLALNRQNIATNDVFFSNRISSKGISDQKSSGRCWLFTGLNVIRAKVISKYSLSQFQFSQNYSFFWDQLEKSNLFLQEIIETKDKPLDDKKVDWLFKNPIGDGGQWTGVVNITQKYGLVPSDVMPETKNTDNTSVMSSLLGYKLRESGLQIREMASKGQKTEMLEAKKKEVLAEVYKMLVYCLGEPPSEFNWRYKSTDGKISELKKYTPLSFFKDFVNLDLTTYVMFMNDPSRPFFKLYEIENDRHTYDGNNWKYINLPVEEIKKIAIASILDTSALYFSCDVGKQLNSEKGLLDVNNYDYGSLFDVKFGMNKIQRIQSFESSSSHGMTLVAVDLANGKPVKWLLENSWGSSAGFEGHLIMTDQWFEEYMFRLVANKKYVSTEILKISVQKPIVLPPWDPMFSQEL
ncbi:MAG: C1 family peptidase [Bacteroidales bacterium]